MREFNSSAPVSMTNLSYRYGSKNASKGTCSGLGKDIDDNVKDS